MSLVYYDDPNVDYDSPLFDYDGFGDAPAPTPIGGVLGCGRWRVFLQCRGGNDNPLLELPFSGMTMNRRIDDMSSATVTLSAGRLSQLSAADYVLCAGILADLEPWESEISIWRDDYEAWVGPVIDPVWKTDVVEIGARDLFQWFERRLLPRDRDFVNVDLADIFQRLASDALHRDVSPHIAFSPTVSGVLGSRKVQAAAFRRSADELRELLRSGVDMTMEARTMHVGGVEVPVAELGTLWTEHFNNLQLTYDGLQTETESVVIGANTNTAAGPVSAVSGAPMVGGIRTVDPVRGLVQNAVSESSVLDLVSAQAAADSRQALLATTPYILTGELLPGAPVTFAQLLPGARADLRVQLMCRQVVGMNRLQSVDVNVDQAGVEKIGVTFTNLGTLEEV